MFLLSFLNPMKQHTKLFNFGESFGLTPYFIFYFLFSLFCLSFLYSTVTEQYPVENIVAVTDQITSNLNELKKITFRIQVSRDNALHYFRMKSIAHFAYIFFDCFKPCQLTACYSRLNLSIPFSLNLSIYLHHHHS